MVAENTDIKNLEGLANSGDEDSMFNLGNFYYFGEGVLNNFNKAREWYEKAAALGHAEKVPQIIKVSE